jgi:hypothetical protein
MRTRSLTVVIAVLLLAVACLAAEFWEKKDYRNWSRAEATRLLENSPWSQQVTLGAVNINVSQRNATSSLPRGSLGAPSAGRENVPRITYTVQLRSAPIVRQAVIRMSQFDLKYEKMTPDQRARFDAKAQSYIGGKDEEVVAYVTFDSNVPSYRSDLHSFWLRQSVDLLKSTTFLNAGGKKLRSSTSFIPVTKRFS